MGKFEERETRLEQMKNRLKNLEADHKKAARKRETRRLILMGRWVENKINSGRIQEAELLRDLDQWLTHDWDRELFALPPLEEPKPSLKKKTPSSSKKTDAAPGAEIVAATSKEHEPITEEQPAPVIKNEQENDTDENKTTRRTGKLQETGVSLAEFNL